MTDWTSNGWEALPPGHGRSPTVSVIVPSYGGEDRLAAVLEAVAQQRPRPKELEVLVVDDGSDPPLRPDLPAGLEVRLLRQERDGFGLSRARRLGAAHARGDVLVFLDSDMLPGDGWLEGHLDWHRRSDLLVSVGFRRHVARTEVTRDELCEAGGADVLLADDEATEPGWIEAEWRRTDDGLRRSDRLWRITSGGNLGVSRSLYVAAGGFDAVGFNRWGGEDNDFGYRAYQAGAFIVPARGAVAWHLGVGTSHGDEAQAHRRRVQLQLSGRICDSGLPDPGPIAPVAPEVVVDIDARGSRIEAAIGDVAAVLSATRPRGVAVSLRVDPADGGVLGSFFAAEGRVHVARSPLAGLDRWPAARVVARGHVGAWKPGVVDRIAERVAEGRTAVLRLVESPDGPTAVEAALVRVHRQIARGLLTAETAFADYGGRYEPLTGEPPGGTTEGTP